MAVGCSDHVIYLYDIYLHTCVRRFTNCQEGILDLVYSECDGVMELVFLF